LWLASCSASTRTFGDRLHSADRNASARDDVDGGDTPPDSGLILLSPAPFFFIWALLIFLEINQTYF
jgi:hypothetical protein